MEYLTRKLNEDLTKGLMPARVLVGRFRFMDDEARYSNESMDPRHYPFFYYLGKEINPARVCFVGVGDGLSLSAFLTGCKGVRTVLGVQEAPGVHYSDRTARANIRMVYRGDLTLHTSCDEISGAWDFCSVEEPKKEILDTVWTYLAENGILCINKTRDNKSLVKDFSISKRREVTEFNTRYGTALLEK